MIKRLFCLLMIALPLMASAQDETVLKTQNSGCLSKTRGYMDEWIPAIVLEKDSNTLTVEVQNFISNCATSDFVVKSSISESSDSEPLTLSAEVFPVYSELQADCMCPFNVTFTVRDLETNTFYLNCGWYKGLVELTDGEPLVLKEKEDDESLLSESKVWTMAYKLAVNPEVYGDLYKFVDTKLVGDTIINNIHFKQKYCREWHLGEETPAEWTATDNYLGLESGKVYLYSDKNKMIAEDMDFSLNVGDERICYYQYDNDKEMPLRFVATAVSDSILNNTDIIVKRRCIHVQLLEDQINDYPQDSDIWINGIGSVKFGIDGMGLFEATGSIPKLYRVTDGDAVIYQSDNDLPVVINETNFPDAAFRKYVGYQYDKNQDGILNEEEISEAMSMFLFDGDISDVKGIEFLTALQLLYCTGSQIESLDLSKCKALTSVECIDNHKLTTLDVSGCKALTKLSCSGGQLTSLDVSGLTALTSLDCSNNRLTSLDVLELTSLTSLYCNNNALPSLDVSMNTELQYLGCDGNQLTQINVTQNKNLKRLSCHSNLLTELDLSQNPELEMLKCWGNQLTALDVSKNTKMTGIYCYSNLFGEAQMGMLVESLPVVEKGYLIAIDTADGNEGNVINMELAAAANAKGWFVKDQSGWYIGDDPTISNNDFRTWTEGEVSMWFTITSWENKTCKVKANQAISGQTEGHVTIPREANYYTVTGIGQSAFHGCNKMTGISIPETVTSIEADAFGSCSSLTSVIIPNSVREVGRNAFSGCSSLTSVTLSDSMYEISDALFHGCSSLASVTMPESVSTIGGAAFEGCSSLTSVSIPDYLETIGGLAFENCTSLASISLPSRLRLLGNSAFHNCSSLTSITIPDAVYRLDSYTFGGCSSLASVTIGSGVGSIENHVFSDCSVLADVYCKAESVPKTDILAFDSTDISQATLHVPKSALEAYQSTKPWSEFGKIVAIGETDIHEVKASVPAKSSYYSLSGIRLKSPSKGINIIRQSDGTTRKVIVR